MIKGHPAKVSDALKEEIYINFKSLMKMREHGVDLFFVNIDEMINKLEKEFVSN